MEVSLGNCSRLVIVVAGTVIGDTALERVDVLVEAGRVEGERAG